MAEGSGRIGIPELAVGVPFPTLPFEIVGARVSAQNFRQLVFSGRTVPPAEALALGLVDEMCRARRPDAARVRRRPEQLTRFRRSPSR